MRLFAALTFAYRLAVAALGRLARAFRRVRELRSMRRIRAPRVQITSESLEQPIAKCDAMRVRAICLERCRVPRNGAARLIC